MVLIHAEKSFRYMKRIGLDAYSAVFPIHTGQWFQYMQGSGFDTLRIVVSIHVGKWFQYMQSSLFGLIHAGQCFQYILCSLFLYMQGRVFEICGEVFMICAVHYFRYM